ncbi:garvicin Q family class II bacteriocin [Streptococcus phocae subsp. phocae]
MQNGKWDYIVTKGSLETTLGIMCDAWVSSLSGGYFHSDYKG